MAWWKVFLDRLRALRESDAVHREIDEEMRFHLDMRAEEYVRRGMSPEEARREAERRFGRFTRIKEMGYDVRGGGWLETLWQDLRFGLRSLRKHPGFTTITLLSLALGIGVNTAQFSVVDAVLIKRLPVKKPDELVLFKWLSGPKWAMGTIDGNLSPDEKTGLDTSSSFSYYTYQQFRAQSQTLTDVFAFAPVEQLNVNAGESAEITSGQLVSGNYYAALGAAPFVGRAITEADDQAAATPVAVLSHPFWQRCFGGDRAVVGRTLSINNVPFTIIGVAPPEFFGTLDVGEAPDISMPLAVEPRLRQGNRSNLNEPWNWWLRVMGRVKPGVNHEQVREELAGVLHRTALEGWEMYPAEKKTAPEQQGARDIPLLGVESGSQGLNDVRKGY